VDLKTDFYKCFKPVICTVLTPLYRPWCGNVELIFHHNNVVLLMADQIRFYRAKIKYSGKNLWVWLHLNVSVCTQRMPEIVT